jgi:hypothetical protein
MICPKCGFKQEDGSAECAKCGVIFRKFLENMEACAEKNGPVEEEQPKISFDGIIKELLFSIEPETNRLYFTGRVITFLFVFIWGCIMILSPLGAGYASSSFMHLVNLPFHEAGHIFSRPFGQWITSLGGTLGQLLMPMVCLVVFLLKAKNPFGASVCLWWFGENFMDITPYIDDARSLSLPLLGGNIGQDSPYGFHDWEYILNEIGLIQYDHTIAKASFGLGTILMLISFVWGGYLLLKQYKDLWPNANR